MKLEIQHIAHYLPYGLKILQEGDLHSLNSIYYLDGEITAYAENKDKWSFTIDEVKPILRPLTDLKFSVTQVSGETFCMITKLYEYAENQVEEDFVEHILNFQDKPNEINWNSCPWYAMVLLFKNHYDVFGLISQNLAIDINQLNN